jgi:hypothetical protein
MDPVVIAEIDTHTDMELHCGSLRSTYRVNVLRPGRVRSVHRGSSLDVGPGAAVLYQP